MDWIVALLYILSALLAVALLMCGALLYVSWRNHLFARRQPASVPPHAPATNTTETPLPPQQPVWTKAEQDHTDTLPQESRQLWDKLHKLLEEEEVWRDPELTLNRLSALMGSNRTRVSRLIQEAGYGGYKDLINRYRVEAFLKLAGSGKMEFLAGIFFQCVPVGFQESDPVFEHPFLLPVRLDQFLLLRNLDFGPDPVYEIVAGFQQHEKEKHHRYDYRIACELPVLAAEYFLQFFQFSDIL